MKHHPPFNYSCTMLSTAFLFLSLDLRLPEAIREEEVC